MGRAVRRALRIILVLIVVAGVAACGAAAPWGSKARIDRAADEEGALVIYANTGDQESAALLGAFRRAHPAIKVSFQRQNSAELYQRYVADIAAGRPSADLVWSSAMDLQIKLVNDGYAQTYAPADKNVLPTWAVWKDQGYGVTAEPIVFVYDKRRLARPPASHAELLAMLRAGAIPGSIGTFDPQRSGVGFLYYSQDRLAWPQSLALSDAMGAGRPKLYESTATLLTAVTAGEIVLGYNVIGSYAAERAAEAPEIGVVFPSDYTLVMSRIAFVSKNARHPNAAKALLGFMLSKEGQALLAAGSLRPVRADVAGPQPPGPSPEAARPIEVGPGLLANLDQMRRARLLEDWRRAIGPNRTDDFRRVRDRRMTGNAP